MKRENDAGNDLPEKKGASDRGVRKEGPEGGEGATWREEEWKFRSEKALDQGGGGSLTKLEEVRGSGVNKALKNVREHVRVRKKLHWEDADLRGVHWKKSPGH